MTIIVPPHGPTQVAERPFESENLWHCATG